MPPEFDPSQCLVLNTLMAARSIARRYDARLRPFGVTAAQFAVLMAVSRKDGQTVTAIADRISADRTTLSRNLDLLERKGLIASSPGGAGPGRFTSLTPKGAKLVDQLVPEWQAEQDKLKELLPGQSLDGLLAALKTITAGENRQGSARVAIGPDRR